MDLLKKLCVQRELKQRIAKNRTRLYRTAYAWCHDHHLSSDLVQETMAKAMKNVAQLRDTDKLDSWLFGIQMNCWRDHFRGLKETSDIEDLESPQSETPEAQFHTQDIVSNVRSAIERLAEKQRQIVTLVELEGFSYAEVADILDIPVGTVMSRLSRARANLARYLLSYKLNNETSNKPALRRIK